MNRAQFLAGAAALALAARLPDFAFAAGENLQHFVSRPDLKPPVVAARGATRDFVFVAPSSGPGQNGAMILDARGDLVWFHPTPGIATTDFKVQRLHGKPVLTWWEGKDAAGTGNGRWVIVDSSYREVARIDAARGLHADLHDFQLTAHGTALGLSNEALPWRHGTLIGGVVQELDVPSGRLLHEWRSVQHVEPDETAIRAKPARDSTTSTSTRSTRTATATCSSPRATPGRVRARTAETGRSSGGSAASGATSRSLAARASAWQHDVRHHARRRRQCLRQRRGPGGGTGVARIAPPRRRAAPAGEPSARVCPSTRTHPLPFHGQHAGAPGRPRVRRLGRLPVLHGVRPRRIDRVRRASPARRPELSRVPLPVDRDRRTRRPPSPPRTGSCYASWNGATEVTSWQLVEDGRAAQTVPRQGFETALHPSSGIARAGVIALDARGAPLGRSATIDV